MHKQVVKTLPHIVPALVAKNNLAAYAGSYTLPILKYLDSLTVIDKKVTFTKLKQIFHNSDWERTVRVFAAQQYAIRGDLIEFWPPGYLSPLRAEYFGEDLEDLYIFDFTSSRKQQSVSKALLSTSQKLEPDEVESVQVNLESEDSLDTAIFTSYPLTTPQKELLGAWEYLITDFTYPQLFWNKQELLVAEIKRMVNQGFEVKLISNHAEQILPEVSELIKEAKYKDPIWNFIESNIPAGFTSNQQQVALITDREIFGSIYLSQRKHADDNVQKLLQQLEGEIAVGDYVVHEEYGIAIYGGLTQEEVSGQMQEYVELKYAGEDKLLLPLNQIHKLTRYIGPEGFAPEIKKLNQRSWENEQTKVKKTVTILARELVEHYARRNLAQAIAINAEDSAEYKKFVSKFAYTPTSDQIKSFNEVLFDMQSTKPMNRLLIGDVGFGKTEVIIRAAFKMVEAGYQVAVLCPTTILAAQHFAVFSARFADTKYKIASMSRFSSDKENKEQAEQITLGEVDIVIGTHRILSKDVQFANLGLLVVDEEQRFGVKQKEKIKQFNYGVHHLAVSATPIPRTLSMSLSSIQDISILAEPPRGRKPVETQLIDGEWGPIVKAILHETERGGQVYFLHNQVRNILSIKSKIEQLIPKVRIIVAHGQMSPATLDKAMSDFYQHKADILLCTTIIENGLDVPNVNTMIVHQAERFGLSQLYQLRGRVGRSDKQAYCYLLTSVADKELAEAIYDDKGKQIPKLSRERLQALVDASHLGAGFQIASRDLELRGAGDLLGEKQSGQISKIGYALYMQLLAAEISRLKQQADLLTQKPEYVSI